MVELRVLQITDVEDDLDKLQVVRDFLAEQQGTDYEIDAVFNTGDWIHGHPSENPNMASSLVKQAFEGFQPDEEQQEHIQRLQEFMSEHDGQKIEDLTDDERQQMQQLQEQQNQMLSTVVVPAIEEAYQGIAEVCAEISANTPIYGVLGNHDLTVAYDILDDHVTFLERQDELVRLTGKSGVEFKMRGDNNVQLVPGFWHQLTPILREHFVPYESGYSIGFLSTRVRELESAHSEAVTKKLQLTSDGEDTEQIGEEIKELENELTSAKATREAALNYRPAEARRLGGSPQPLDFYLSHRTPTCGDVRQVVGSPCSDTTAEFSQFAGTVYGGHFHDGQIGNHTLAHVVAELEKDDAETNQDGVRMYYLDADEPWHLNAGNKHVLVTEYDVDKNVIGVDIYRYVCE